ncbi:MAG: hypothetical protein M3N13_06875 [Candidatus Eremiobacteraeota bacterium]|nr:hypothetical protein [Candidatus Eremiobacteraeota bacterium]
MRHAIVRTPCANFAEGLTSLQIGVPTYARVLEQHAAYCDALERCGLEVIHLDADPRFPDSTFVEDTAILTARGAVLTRPGAPSRAGEVAALREPLRQFFDRIETIVAPGTIDGGDVCEAGDHFYIGISKRTNRNGA